MAKRFVDIGLWDKPWFRKLPPEEKEAWRFICDKSDTVGVWEADTEIAEAYIGAKVDWVHLRESCNGNITVLKNGKWFLRDFCAFQYGELVDTNNAHRSYLSLLKKHGLLGAGQGLARGCPAPLDKDKERDKDKEKIKSTDFDTFYAAYPRKVNKAGALRAWGARVKDGSLLATEVMAAVREYTKQVAGKELEFVMHPATFLGPAMRWKDYLTSGSKFVPASKANDDLAWTCGGCGEKYRSTSTACVKCGWERGET